MLGAVLFARPAEMVRGGLDSGAYVNAGVALGRTGSIIIRDRLMRELNNDLPGGGSEVREVLQEYNRDRYALKYQRMPGFYVLDKQDAAIIPQHYSFYPVWIAIFYQLFGLWGALYATPVLALLAVSGDLFLHPARLHAQRGAAGAGADHGVPGRDLVRPLPGVGDAHPALRLCLLLRLRQLSAGPEPPAEPGTPPPTTTPGSAAGGEARRMAVGVRLFGVLAGWRWASWR